MFKKFFVKVDIWVIAACAISVCAITTSHPVRNPLENLSGDLFLTLQGKDVVYIFSNSPVKIAGSDEIIGGVIGNMEGEDGVKIWISSRFSARISQDSKFQVAPAGIWPPGKTSIVITPGSGLKIENQKVIFLEDRPFPPVLHWKCVLVAVVISVTILHIARISIPPLIRLVGIVTIFRLALRCLF